MKPRGILMIEHRLIEKILSLVKNEIEHIDENGAVDQYFVQSIVDFIRTYADRTHHGKEEDILFERLNSKTMDPDDKAMMDDLIEEHKSARLAVSELMKSEAGFIHGDKAQINIIKEKLTFLMNLYPSHIAKEDKLFFPNTERYFTEDELAQMLEDFHTFDRKMIHEKYQMLYESLSTGYQGGEWDNPRKGVINMDTIEKKSLDQPDQTKKIGRVKVEIVTIGGLSFQRDTAEPGWRWSEDVKPVAMTNSCQVNHLIYVISGRLHVKMDDGTEMEYNPGDMGLILPGHDGWTVGDKPAVWLEFQH